LVRAYALEMSQSPVTLITGTSRGIGAAMVEHFVKKGHRVIGCSRSGETKWGDQVAHVSLGVTDEPKVLKLFEDIAAKFGRIDHLINNARAASMNHFLLMPSETARSILDTNVLGTFIFSREAARLMQRQKFGRIVNFGSIADLIHVPGEAMYAASKAAVGAFTKVTAKELAPFGITVNCVCPGAVNTGLTRGVPQEKLDAILSQQAIQRLAAPADILNAVEFFLKPESEFITGQLLYLGAV
jgi:3-oxoacyl-[acyl-carrier protein] reductase